MIVAEIKNPTVTVRIHDDFFDTAHQARINRISQIVTDHYKRRQAEMESHKEEHNQLPLS